MPSMRLLYLLLLCLLPAHTLAAEEAASHPGDIACEYARELAPQLTAATLADAPRRLSHRRNTLATVKAAERRVEDTEKLQELLASCSWRPLTLREWRWLEGTVEDALGLSVVGQNDTTGSAFLQLAELIGHAVESERQAATRLRWQRGLTPLSLADR
jgi:hypothetical protein